MPGLSTACQKSFAEFAAEAANKMKIIFGGGVYFDKNTYQFESVSFVCPKRTNDARVKLQTPGGKAHKGFFASFKKVPAVCRDFPLLVQKSFAEFAAGAANKMKIIFGGKACKVFSTVSKAPALRAGAL